MQAFYMNKLNYLIGMIERNRKQDIRIIMTMNLMMNQVKILGIDI